MSDDNPVTYLPNRKTQDTTTPTDTLSHTIQNFTEYIFHLNDGYGDDIIIPVAIYHDIETQIHKLSQQVLLQLASKIPKTRQISQIIQEHDTIVIVPMTENTKMVLVLMSK